MRDAVAARRFVHHAPHAATRTCRAIDWSLADRPPRRRGFLFGGVTPAIQDFQAGAAVNTYARGLPVTGAANILARNGSQGLILIGNPRLGRGPTTSR